MGIFVFNVCHTQNKTAEDTGHQKKNFLVATGLYQI